MLMHPGALEFSLCSLASSHSPQELLFPGGRTNSFTCQYGFGHRDLLTCCDRSAVNET